MTSALDDAATALVAAEEHVASITAERDALLARVNELDDEVARLTRGRDEARAELERMRDVVERLRDAAERALTFLAEESSLETSDWSKAPLEHLRTVVRLAKGGGIDHRPTSDAPTTLGVSGSALAAAAAALELVAECWEQNPFDVVGYTRALRSFGWVLRDKARELREGK